MQRYTDEIALECQESEEEMQREAHVNYVTDKELIIKTFKKFKASKSVNNVFLKYLII